MAMAMAMASSSSTLPNKKITLLSSDDQAFSVEASILNESKTITHMLEDTEDYSEAPIPLPNIRGLVLNKVIEYCKKHTAKQESEEEVKKWDEEFVNVERSVLFEIISAANYLDIYSLLDLTCTTIADQIKDLPVAEIRDILGIVNDFTPEEEAQVIEETRWAYE